MVRLTTWAIALMLALTPASALACAPDMIFFKPGSVRLGTSDLQMIARLAKDYRAQPRRRVILYAQGDTSRPVRANVRLAQRRGEAVRAALVQRGVPRGHIVIRVQSDGRAVVFEWERTKANCG